MSEDDPTQYVSEDMIVELLGEIDKQEQVSSTFGLDFANSLLYRLESALSAHYGHVGTCHCGTEIHTKDIKRGDCPSCLRDLTVSTGDRRVTL